MLFIILNKLFSKNKLNKNVVQNNNDFLNKILSEKIFLNEPEVEGDITKEQHEIINQISNAAGQVYSSRSPELVKSSLNDILLRKRQREGTYELYELSLRRNILFYLYRHGYNKKLIEAWIINKNIPEVAVAEKQLAIIRDSSLTINAGNKVALKNGNKIQEDILNVFNIYDSITSLDQRIEQLEFDYQYAHVKNNIMLNFTLTMSHNSSSIEGVLIKENIDAIIHYIDFIIDYSTSLSIGNIEFKI